MAEDGGAPVWDENLADRLIGKTILVGYSYVAADATLLDQRQFHGEVVRCDPSRGICLELKGAHDGETFWLPPETRVLKPAKPGEYRLRETGEIVRDPDFLTTWTVSKNRN